MAFLIAATGRGDLVDHVARTRNNAYVAELADETGLAEWLDRHGLTLAEAARIQPTYGGHVEADVPAAILGIRALGARSKAVASRSSRVTLAPLAVPGSRPRLGFQASIRF